MIADAVLACQVRERVLKDLQIFEHAGALAASNGTETKWLEPGLAPWHTTVYFDRACLGLFQVEAQQLLLVSRAACECV